MSLIHTAQDTLMEHCEESISKPGLSTSPIPTTRPKRKGHEGRMGDAGSTTPDDHTTTTRRPVPSKRSVSGTESFAPINKERSDGGHFKEKS